jgi:hypothetical protein
MERAIALTIDYALALFFLAEKDETARKNSTKDTQESTSTITALVVQALTPNSAALRAIQSGKMGVIRFPHRKGAQLFCDSLRKIRNHVGWNNMFDIILDTGSTPLNLEPHFLSAHPTEPTSRSCP